MFLHMSLCFGGGAGKGDKQWACIIKKAPECQSATFIAVVNGTARHHLGHCSIDSNVQLIISESSIEAGDKFFYSHFFTLWASGEESDTQTYGCILESFLSLTNFCNKKTGGGGGDKRLNVLGKERQKIMCVCECLRVSKRERGLYWWSIHRLPAEFTLIYWGQCGNHLNHAGIGQTPDNERWPTSHTRTSPYPLLQSRIALMLITHLYHRENRRRRNSDKNVPFALRCFNELIRH